jgi:transposase
VRLETRIPADHPLRAIRELIDEALRELSRTFNRLYAREGRPSIPPERLLRSAERRNSGIVRTRGEELA